MNYRRQHFRFDHQTGVHKCNNVFYTNVCGWSMEMCEKVLAWVAKLFFSPIYRNSLSFSNSAVLIATTVIVLWWIGIYYTIEFRVIIIKVQLLKTEKRNHLSEWPGFARGYTRRSGETFGTTIIIKRLLRKFSNWWRCTPLSVNRSSTSDVRIPSWWQLCELQFLQKK